MSLEPTDPNIVSGNIVYGRLLESVHLSGYTASRACDELEWLLDGERWKSVGNGFDSGRKFLATINLQEFKWATERRQRLSKQLFEILKDVGPSSIGRALGVDETTIRRDLGMRSANAEHPVASSSIQKGTGGDISANAEPKIITQSGIDAAQQLREKAHVSRNTGENEWYTPAEYIEVAADVLGAIDLDPASTETANVVIQAKKIYTADNNGLAQKWIGRVWLNPPYAPGLIERFMEKLGREYESGNVSAAIALVNNATETAWFQVAASISSAMCFPSRRVRFWSPERIALAQPLQGQALLYFGEQCAQFTESFARFGLVAEIVHGQ